MITKKMISKSEAKAIACRLLAKYNVIASNEADFSKYSEKEITLINGYLDKICEKLKTKAYKLTPKK